MQFEIALRTFPARIETSYEDRATVRTTRACYRPHHPRRARAEVVRRSSRAALRRLAISVFLFVSFLFLGITIAAVTVLAIHKRLRPSAAPDRNYNWLTTVFKRIYSRYVIRSERYNCQHTSLPF